jgi:ParB-like chromosome segregation protein Spo0J
VIDLASLVIDQKVQVRPSLDGHAVAQYAAAYHEHGAEALGRITVYDSDQGRLLVDGFHRVTAARRLGLEQLPAEVRRGTWLDALEAAVMENVAHGMRIPSFSFRISCASSP